MPARPLAPKPLPQRGCWELASRAQGSEAGRREPGGDFCPINSPLPAVRVYVRGDGVCLRRAQDGEDIWTPLPLERYCFEQCNQVNALID